MPVVVRRPRTEQDLLAIWNDTWRRWGAEQADHYVRSLNAAIDALGEFPERGPACDWIRQGYRRLVVRHHCVFYRIGPDVVEIVRVLHERMDWEEFL